VYTSIISLCLQYVNENAIIIIVNIDEILSSLIKRFDVLKMNNKVNIEKMIELKVNNVIGGIKKNRSTKILLYILNKK